MKKLMFLLLTLLVGTAGVKAFTATTLSSDTLPYNTYWYTISIGDDNEILAYDSSTGLTIAESSKIKDAILWCFVENGSGYTLYNKAAGVGYALYANGSTLEMSSTGTTAWTVSETDDGYTIGDGTYYIATASGAPTLSTTSATCAIEFGERTLLVNLNNGSFTSTSSSSSWNYLWTSSESTDPALTLNSGGKNNMTKDSNYSGLIVAAGGSAKDTDYTLATSTGYVISSYSLSFLAYDSSAESLEVTVDGTTYNPSTSAYTNVEVTGLSSSSVMAFNISLYNCYIILNNFYVTIQADASNTQNLFEADDDNGVGYRIPALAKTRNGDLIAVADFRWCGNDVGHGRIDLHYTKSTDNGETWSTVSTIKEGTDAGNDENGDSIYGYGYGDVAIVADIASDSVLILCCATDTVVYGSSSSTKYGAHQGICRIYSTDGGDTWDADNSVDISDDLIYALFSDPVCMFVTSGRIYQTTRKATNAARHRIYCAVLYYYQHNYVLYSDDFGATWAVLGGISTYAISSSADEAKVEELPDGSIFISSRTSSGGRIYNIFTYTDFDSGSGSWGTQASSTSDNNGVSSDSGCNGEILTVPATRTSDGADVYLALQSMPFGSGRYNLGIYYKELESQTADYADSETFAGDWDGSYQISSTSSAYSTMQLLDNGMIGLLFEESIYSYGNDTGFYEIIYKSLDLEDITGGDYTLRTDVDRSTTTEQLTETLLDESYNSLASNTLVGASTTVATNIAEAYTAYKESQTYATYEAYLAALADPSSDTSTSGDALWIEEGAYYVIYNYQITDYRLACDLWSTPEYAAADSLYGYTGYPDLWQFIPTSTDSSYYVYNPGRDYYLGQTQSSGCVSVPLTSTAEHTWTVGKYQSSGSKLQLTCDDGLNSTYFYLNVTRPKVVNWGPWANSTANCSFWYIEKIDTTDLDDSFADIVATKRATDTDEYTALLAAYEAYTGGTGSFNTMYKAMFDYYRVAQPSSGKFYRLKGNISGNYVLNGSVTSGGNSWGSMGSISSADNSDENFISSIYYYNTGTDSTMINYQTGYMLGVRWVQTLYDSSYSLEWSRSSNFFNRYLLKSPSGINNSAYMYDGTTFVNRNSTLETGGNNEWILEDVDSIPVKLNGYGYATFYCPVNVVVPTGVTAYTIGYNDSLTATTVIHTYEAGSVVPGGTAVLLSSDGDITSSYINFTITDDEGTESNTYLVGEVYTYAPGSGAYYILSGDKFYKVSISEDDTSVNYINGSKAFLDASSASTSAQLSLSSILSDGEVTGVGSLIESALADDAPYYDLQGRRVNNPARGIYIRNGRKVYVK